jgi:GMP synthase-like glutamine amidotransferase
MTVTLPLKIAVLINGFEGPNTAAVRASFVSAITAASVSIQNSSSPTIDFFDPVVTQIHPDPSKYDLIVLSGGTVDPMGSDPWVLKLQGFLRSTIKDHPKQKMVGICWGHQTICVALGGTVGSMDAAEIGVRQINLTDEGTKMFPFAKGGHAKIHEFHRREIKVPPEGFDSLAEGNQVFLSETDTVLTFQGHPEMNADLAKSLLASSPAYMGVEEGQKEALAKNMESIHDGVHIWQRILAWVMK